MSQLYNIQDIDIATVPTRLFSLKYGANLVWGPETVDKAILHATRVVDRKHNPPRILRLKY